MPIKRRTPKCRHSIAAEVEAWTDVFDSEFDFFGDLEASGVAVDGSSRPDRAETEAAWHRLGAHFLAQRDSAETRPPWALSEFGEPSCQ